MHFILFISVLTSQFATAVFFVQNKVLVQTGTGTDNGGNVKVIVDHGWGTESVPHLADGFYGPGQTVYSGCFDSDVVGVQIQNTNYDGWAGTVQINGKDAICANCDGTTDTMPIVVDGDGDASVLASTQCLNGKQCLLVEVRTM